SFLSKVKVVYLALYNWWCAAGWCFVGSVIFKAVRDGKPPAAAYAESEFVLKSVQTLALLEVVHAAVGLVRSPWTTTLVQVLSRLLVVWCFLDRCHECEASVGFLLCAGSWAAVEVPRYLFYAFNVLGGVPEALFFLRYTLFAVLYPTGITGEIVTMLAGLPCIKALPANFNLGPVTPYHMALFALATYVPGAPYMYLHMVKTRKSAFKKRREGAAVKAAPAASKKTQ
ncbi:unnamed protein product, partial [Phaeothamnion confervicola]